MSTITSIQSFLNENNLCGLHNQNYSYFQIKSNIETPNLICDECLKSQQNQGITSKDTLIKIDDIIPNKLLQSIAITNTNVEDLFTSIHDVHMNVLKSIEEKLKQCEQNTLDQIKNALNLSSAGKLFNEFKKDIQIKMNNQNTIENLKDYLSFVNTMNERKTTLDEVISGQLNNIDEYAKNLTKISNEFNDSLNQCMYPKKPVISHLKSMDKTQIIESTVISHKDNISKAPKDIEIIPLQTDLSILPLTDLDSFSKIITSLHSEGVYIEGDHNFELLLGLLHESIKHCKTNYLNINFANLMIELSDDDMDYIVKPLIDLSQQLNTLILDFHGCSELSYEGLSKLSQVLLEMKHLQHFELNLLECKYITDDGIFQFNKTISTMTNLHTLSLSFGVHSDGLDKCELTDLTLKSLSQTFTELKMLKNLFIEFQDCFKITNNGLKDLSNGLSKLINLEILELNFPKCSHISNAGCRDIIEALYKLTNLKEINMNLMCTQISNKVKQQIKDYAMIKKFTNNII